VWFLSKPAGRVPIPRKCDGSDDWYGVREPLLNLTCRFYGKLTIRRLRPRSSSDYQPVQEDTLDLLEQQQYQQPQAQQQQSPISTLTPSPGRAGLDLLWRASGAMLRRSEESVPTTRARPQPAENRANFNTTETEHGNSLDSSSRDSDGPDGFFGDSSTFAFVSEVPLHSKYENGVHLQNRRRRAQSTSNSNSVQSPVSACHSPEENSPRYTLPEKSLADNLVDVYFDRVHPLYPFVHEGVFRSEYEKIGTNSINSTFPPSWYAVLNMIFASSCEFCDAVPETEVPKTVAPFVARSRDIIFSQVFKSGNLELVQALLLMCHYLQGTMELNECWNLAGLMIRTGVSIGLHLTPERLPITMVEKEVRKRVWWGCFILDRTLSWKFGRPTSIQSTNALDLPLPLAVDDQYIHSDSLAPRQPTARPPIAAFFLHTIKLAQVIDQILQVLYTTSRKELQQRGPDKSVISHILGQAVLLDGQLQDWWDDAPLHLRPHSRIADGQIFQRQQTVLHLRYARSSVSCLYKLKLFRYLTIRILLQRQVLLVFSRQDIDDHFLRAIAVAGSQTCISAARETIRLIYTQYRHRLLNSLCYNLHCSFSKSELI
jgi:hypothetical protein